MMENKILLFMQFGVELIRYWLGMTVLFGGRIKRIWIAIISYGIFAGLLFLGNIQILDLTMLMWVMILVIYFVTTETPSSKGQKWKVYNAFVLFYQEELLCMLVNDIVYYHWKMMTDYEMELLGSILALIIVGISAVIYKKYKGYLQGQRLSSYLQKSMIPMAILVVIEIMVVIAGFNYIAENSGNEKQHLLGMILSFLSMISIGILAVIVFYIKNTNDRMERMLVMEKQMQQLQLQYYETLLKKEEETRRYRHDLNSHLVCLNRLIWEEDIEGAKVYIEEMQERMEYIKNYSFCTGIKIMDAILDYYAGQLEESVVVSVRGKCEKIIAVSDIDMCTILANLIQNAVEGIKTSKQDNRFLSVKINAGENFVKIEIKNSMDIDKIYFDKEGKLQTSKDDKKNHGIGMLNVKEALLKNSGKFQFCIENSQFYCQVVLPIRQNMTDNLFT